MVRRFLYLMITVIALQFSWSVIAAYCMHGAEQDHQHFGHRQQTLLVEDHAESEQQGQEQAKNSVHHHHSVCAHGVLALTDITESLFHPLAINVAPLEVVTHPSSIYTLPPERPQWQVAV